LQKATNFYEDSQLSQKNLEKERYGCGGGFAAPTPITSYFEKALYEV
jgi:hypothetical protein